MKYKLGEKHKDFDLYRVVYLRDIPRHGIKKGTIGGWIAHEDNLSQEGDCVVLDDARVYGNAWVYGNAQVFDNATVFGNAMVFGGAWVGDNAKIGGNMALCENRLYREAPTLLSQIIERSKKSLSK